MMGLSEHEAFIINLARVVRPKLFVKLGLFQCELFNRITPYAEKSIGVDPLPEAAKFMKQSHDTRFVMGTGREFAKELEVRPLKINMLFIDGEHFKETGSQDIHEFFPFIAPQGFILLQDPYSEKAEMLKSESYDLMTIPASPGLAICRKR